MKLSYLRGFNDALNGIYLNPYDDKKQMDEFMQYHNGHNSGSYHNRNLLFISTYIFR